MSIRFAALLGALILTPTLALAQMAAAPFEGRLKKIHDSKSITVAYRTDAVPFSFEENGKPNGYSVELCQRVINIMERQLGTPLETKWLAVNAQNRFTAVSSGQADMECGASTVTLGRMKEVDFSSLIYADATAVLVRASTEGNAVTALANKKIAVIAGTSNERALNDALKGRAITATVVPVKSREEGLQALESGAVDGLAGDRLLLVGLMVLAKNPQGFALLSDALSYEPYGIALPRGDWAMRQSVNAALSRIYSSPVLPELYGRWFKAVGNPSLILEILYALGRLPE